MHLAFDVWFEVSADGDEIKIAFWIVARTFEGRMYYIGTFYAWRDAADFAARYLGPSYAHVAWTVKHVVPYVSTED